METKPTHCIASIYDTKAGIFFAPQTVRSKADFIRQVQVAAKDKNSMFNKFPADYELFIVGTWNEYNGVSSIEKERLGSVLDLCPLE